MSEEGDDRSGDGASSAAQSPPNVPAPMALVRTFSAPLLGTKPFANLPYAGEIAGPDTYGNFRRHFFEQRRLAQRAAAEEEAQTVSQAAQHSVAPMLAGLPAPGPAGSPSRLSTLERSRSSSIGSATDTSIDLVAGRFPELALALGSEATISEYGEDFSPLVSPRERGSQSGGSLQPSREPASPTRESASPSAVPSPVGPPAPRREAHGAAPTASAAAAPAAAAAIAAAATAASASLAPSAAVSIGSGGCATVAATAVASRLPEMGASSVIADPPSGMDTSSVIADPVSGMDAGFGMAFTDAGYSRGSSSGSVASQLSLSGLCTNAAAHAHAGHGPAHQPPLQAQPGSTHGRAQRSARRSFVVANGTRAASAPQPLQPSQQLLHPQPSQQPQWQAQPLPPPPQPQSHLQPQPPQPPQPQPQQMLPHPPPTPPSHQAQPLPTQGPPTQPQLHAPSPSIAHPQTPYSQWQGQTHHSGPQATASPAGGGTLPNHGWNTPPDGRIGTLVTRGRFKINAPPLAPQGRRPPSNLASYPSQQARASACSAKSFAPSSAGHDPSQMAAREINGVSRELFAAGASGQGLQPPMPQHAVQSTPMGNATTAQATHAAHAAQAGQTALPTPPTQLVQPAQTTQSTQPAQPTQPTQGAPGGAGATAPLPSVVSYDRILLEQLCSQVEQCTRAFQQPAAAAAAAVAGASQGGAQAFAGPATTAGGPAGSTEAGSPSPPHADPCASLLIALESRRDALYAENAILSQHNRQLRDYLALFPGSPAPGCSTASSSHCPPPPATAPATAPPSAAPQPPPSQPPPSTQPSQPPYPQTHMPPPPQPHPQSQQPPPQQPPPQQPLLPHHQQQPQPLQPLLPHQQQQPQPLQQLQPPQQLHAIYPTVTPQASRQPSQDAIPMLGSLPISTVGLEGVGAGCSMGGTSAWTAAPCPTQAPGAPQSRFHGGVNARTAPPARPPTPFQQLPTGPLPLQYTRGGGGSSSSVGEVDIADSACGHAGAALDGTSPELLPGGAGSSVSSTSRGPSHGED